MNWQKSLKIVLIGLSVIVILSVGSMIYFLSKLPSRGQIQQTMQAMTTPSSPPQGATPDTASAPSLESTRPAQAVQAQATSPTKENVNTKQAAEQMFLKLAYEDPRTIEVCKNLSKAKDFEPIAATNNAVDEFLKNIETDNPYLRTIRPAAKYILQRPQMKELVDAMNDKTQKDESLVDKSVFYYKAVRAVQDVQNDQKKVELLADRSMHLYVLSVLAKEHPEIATRPEVLGFCDSIEEKLGQSDVENIESERNDLLDLIKEVGATPEQLQFDPKKRAHMNIKLNPTDLQIGLDFEDPSVKTQVVQ